MSGSPEILRPRRTAKAFLARLRVRALEERGPIARATMWIRLSEAYTDLGRAAQALDCAERACGDATDPHALMRFAEALSVTSREEEAIGVLAQVAQCAVPELAKRALLLSAETSARLGQVLAAARTWRVLLGQDSRAQECDAFFASAGDWNPPENDEGPNDATERPRWRRAWLEARPKDIRCADEVSAHYMASGETGAALCVWSELARNDTTDGSALMRGVELALREQRMSDVLAWYVLHPSAARASAAMPRLARALREMGLGALEHQALMRDVDIAARGDHLSVRRALASLAETEGRLFEAGAELWRGSAMLDPSERMQALLALGFCSRSESDASERATLLAALRAEVPSSPEDGVPTLEALLGYPDLHEAYARRAAELWLQAPSAAIAIHALRGAVLVEDVRLEDEALAYLHAIDVHAGWDGWRVRAAMRAGDAALSLELAKLMSDVQLAPVVHWARILRCAEAAGASAVVAEAWEKLASMSEASLREVMRVASARAAHESGSVAKAIGTATATLQQSDSALARLEALRILTSAGTSPQAFDGWVQAVLETKPSTTLWLSCMEMVANCKGVASDNVARELLHALQSDRYLALASLRAAVALARHIRESLSLRQLFSKVTEPGRTSRAEMAELAIELLPHFLKADLCAAEADAQVWLRRSGVDTGVQRDALLRIADAFGSDRLACDVLCSCLDRMSLSSQDALEITRALATRHAALGDTDAETLCVADALMNAPDEHGDLDVWALQILDEDRGVGADAKLYLAEAVAQRSRRVGVGASDAENAWRRLGKWRWEMGDDKSGAMSAWGEAAALSTNAEPYAELALQAVRTFGPTEAFEVLDHYAHQLGEPRTRGLVRLELAALALQSPGRNDVAFRYARECVVEGINVVRALDICEQSESAELALSEVYEGVAARATGHHGSRTLHMRASLYFERRGHGPLAFEHALRAVVVDPRSSTALARVVHTISWSLEPERAVAALERAAGRVKDGALRVDLRVTAAVVLAGCEGQCAPSLTRLVDAFVRTSDPSFAFGMARIASRASSIPRGVRDAVGRELERALDHVVSLSNARSAATCALSIAEFACEAVVPSAALRGFAIALMRDPCSGGYGALRERLSVLGKAPGASALVGKVAGEVLQWPDAAPIALTLLAELASRVDARSAQARFLLRRAELTKLPADAQAAASAAQGLPDLVLTERVASLHLDGREDPHTRDHVAYADALRSRITQETDKESKAMLRLRRAAVLSDRLGRDAEAVEELEAALHEHPEHSGVAAFLKSLRGPLQGDHAASRP